MIKIECKIKATELI